MTEFSFWGELTLDDGISIFWDSYPSSTLFLLPLDLHVLHLKWAFKKTSLLFPHSNRELDDSDIIDCSIQWNADAMLITCALGVFSSLWRHIKRLENLCEEHGFKRFPFVTVQKWRNAHSKMLLILQDRGYLRDRKAPVVYFVWV